MRVNIGPYKSDIIPVYALERKYERLRADGLWLDEADYTWYDRIIFGTLDLAYKLSKPINRWANNRKRKVSVRIDYYDTWSADNTLALIIHPLLVQLKAVQHGAPIVELEDVPENLHPVNKASPENGYVDDTVSERWNWVLDEMIWAFEQAIEDNQNTNQFSHNSAQLDMSFDKQPDGTSKLKLNNQKDPAKPKYYVDFEARKLHYDRIGNGMRLFAKYYFGLWD